MAQRRARAPWYVGSREQLPGVDVWSYSVSNYGSGSSFITELPWSRNSAVYATFHNGASVYVDWGDGTTTLVNADSTVADMQHTYDDGEKTYVVTLYSTQWSDIQLLNTTYYEASWYFCQTLTELLTPIPTLHEDSYFTDFFYGSRLKTIPADLFSKNTYIKELEGTFLHCSELAELPAGLFDNNTELVNLTSTFAYTAIAEIPVGLFDNCPLIESFYRCFVHEYTSVSRKVPVDLFAKNTKVTDFSYVFPTLVANAECDDGTPYCALEIGSEVVTDVSRFYNSLSGIDAVYVTVAEGSTTASTIQAWNESNPTRALTMNTDPCPVTWEFDTVEVCLEVGVPISTSVAYTGMTIDWGDGNVTTVASVDDYVHTYDTAGQYHITVTYDDWANVELSCTEESVSPIAAARGGIAKVYKIPQVANTSFAYLFYEYNQLTAIEDGLFDNNTQITNFAYTFYNCYQMTTIPENLFASHTLVTDFTQTFRDSGRIDNQTLYIGSEVVTSADMFMYETASYGNLNTVYVPANSTTETTFNSAMNIGCTVATYTP